MICIQAEYFGEQLLLEAVGSCENTLQDVGRSLCTRAEASLERIPQGKASSSRRMVEISSSLSSSRGCASWRGGGSEGCKGDGEEGKASSTCGPVMLCVTFARLYNKQQSLGSGERAGHENSK